VSSNITSFETLDLTKGGYEILQMSLGRSAKGLILSVKAHASIEEFFHTISQGKTQPMSLHGRWWRPVREGLSLPEVYVFSAPLNSKRYSLNAVGQDLITRGDGAGRPISSEDSEDEGYGGPPGSSIANISFLRMKGISEGDGVSLSIPTVQTVEGLRTASKLLREGVKAFYLDFLKPIDVVISMTAQEVRG
jgi:hypothetical protein